MSQRVQVLLVDDLDGGEADETVRFALDGAAYEIDLSQVHAATLRKGLAPYLEGARRSGNPAARRAAATGASGRAAGASGRDRHARHDLAETREWLRANGYPVKDHGRIPASMHAAFQARTPAPPGPARRGAQESAQR